MKKTLLALLLVLSMLLSCACTFGKPEETTAPETTAEETTEEPVEEEDPFAWVDDGVVRPVNAEKGYGRKLSDDPEEDQAIWEYVEQIYREWYSRYLEILYTPDPEINKIRSDNSATFDQIITVYNTQLGSAPTYQGRVRTRTLSSLKDFTPIETEFDEYGGWVNEEMRQEAAGFFRTAKIGDRWYMIDPLGYPTIIRGVSGLTYMYSNAKEQEANMIKRYGEGEKWGIATTRILKDYVLLNACTILLPGSLYIDVADRLCYQDKLTFVSHYESSIGAKDTSQSSGSTLLVAGMHVFEPGFVTYSDNYARTAILEERASYINDPYFIGFATDNEIPVDESKTGITLLLGLDINQKNYDNRYSYAAAWTFLAHQTGKSDPTLSDVTDDIKYLFKGFLYDRYYSVVAPIVRKYDPNHLVMGNRALNGIREASGEWIARFTAYWCDVVTLNWYKDWTPKQDQLNNLSIWCNKPLLITEYFVHSDDSKVDPGHYNYPVKNINYRVNSQADRAKGYENYFLRLLECQNCVGFYWFDSIDRGQNIKGSNKGIFAGDQTLYEELAASMHNIGVNIYGLAQYFDSKY